MTLSLASNAVAGRDVVAGVKARVAAAYSGTVRVVVAPNPVGPEYVAQEGITIRVPVAEPFDRSGAGRAGLLTHRRLEVFVVSMTMVDPADEDENGAYAHLDLEETVIDAVLDFPGGGMTKLGVKVRWVSGGSEIARRVKHDPALMVSVLLFDVEYPAAVRVNRT